MFVCFFVFLFVSVYAMSKHSRYELEVELHGHGLDERLRNMERGGLDGYR